MERKRGRPLTVNRLAPPGKRWCAQCEKFKFLHDFTGTDRYCTVCRKQYNRDYKKRTLGVLLDVNNVTVTSNPCLCGEAFVIRIKGGQETETWNCPNCDRKWSGTISVNLRSKDNG